MPSRDDWHELTAEWLRRIDARAAEPERLRQGLTECIGCGCLSFDACWIANPVTAAVEMAPVPDSGSE